MANKIRPAGARPKGNAVRSNSYIAGGTVYPGDLVKLDSTGRVVVVAAGDASCGASASYATAGQSANVFDDPDQLFVIQSDGAHPNAQTDINLNYNVTATAGNATYKESLMSLDNTSGDTTATLQLKLLAIDSRPDNALGDNCDCIVRINNHQLDGGTGTVGV